MTSFWAGLLFAVVELIFAVVSHSQSVLMDAVYDASESIFIALIIFLTPLFYKPVSEQHPYGFFQVESIFLIIKCVMMISVTLGVAMEIVESAISGGNHVNAMSVSLFQLVLGATSVVIYFILKRMNRKVSSPSVDAELLEWKIDIVYSMGLSLAFFAAMFLENTPLAWLRPYFDPAMAVIVALLMLPETVKMLWGAIKDIFLLPPDQETIDEIKSICNPILEQIEYHPVSYDITKTGRHIWVAVYFEAEEELLLVRDVKRITEVLNAEVGKRYENCTCELILAT